ncbi:MAG: PQQ-binding-like beta-propeller repeat protein [Planctomycetes bacterium]|nr:PQQ-binding-like beta-propeller repeat protein [Planctomycetota bacterium]
MHFYFPARIGRPKLLIVATGFLLFVLGGLFALSGMGQALADERPGMSIATDARPEVVRGNERRLLDQLQRFLDARQWEDAWSLVARLVEADSTSVVPIDESLYVALPAYCHRLLSHLPPEALARYRELVDPIAEAWYCQGVAQRDHRLLRRVVDEMFCSSWGDDALLALGELALGRGEYQAARTHWQAIRGGLSGLTYPDSDINPADLEARLALVSIRAGQWERAAGQLVRFTSSHPDARGRLAGRNVVYAAQLAQLLKQARQWPTPGPQRDWPTAGGGFARTHAARTDARLELQPLWSHAFAAAEKNEPSVFPIVAGELVVYQDAAGVHALHLATGQQAFHSDSATFRSPRSPRTPRFTLTAHENQVFGTESSGALWAVDLDRDGALSFRGRPGDSDAVFSGAPVVDGTHLLLETRTSDRSARAGIACFDLATGKPVWRRWLCRANLPAGEIATNLLTASPGVVYACTNLGAIAAVRTDDGQILWLRTYSRTNFSAAEKVSYRACSPCVYQRGMLFALPADSRQLLALDAATGEILWSRSALQSTAQLVGVTEDRLVLASGGLHLLDPNTGDILKSDFSRQLAG